jgi:hypothetical protein
MRAPLYILALIAALWIASEITRPGVERRGKSRLVSGAIDKGAVHLEIWKVAGASDDHDVGWSFTPNDTGSWSARAWVPRYEHHSGRPGLSLLLFSIPLWPLMVPFAAWFGVAFVRHRRRIRIDLCPCGYDARGLDVCPECGRVSAGVKADRSRG